MPPIRFTLWSTLAALCLLLVGADVNRSPEESAAETIVKATPLDLLQGEWRVTAFDPGGEKALGRLFTFRGSEVLWRNPGAGKPHVQFNLKLGQEGELATFDMSRELNGRLITATGVYRLQGDTLEMHYGWNNQRPTSLERPSGGFSFTLKRVR